MPGFLTENGPDAGLVTTVDATPTYLMSHDFQPNTVCQVVIRVIVRNPSNQNTKCFYRIAVARRVGTGAVALVGGAPQDVQSRGDAALSACEITLSASGGNGRINVTGLAGTTLQWHGIFSALCISDSPLG